MTEKTTAEILRSNAETFEKKTTDYGESWRKIGDIFHHLSNGEPVTLTTPEEFVAMGLFTRRMDKLAREFYGTFFTDEMNFEGPVDSAEDESVYAAMSASNLRTMQEQAIDAELEELEREVLEERMAEGYRKLSAEAESDVEEAPTQIENGETVALYEDADRRDPYSVVNPDELTEEVDAEKGADATPFRAFRPSDLRDC
jgi:hypothetical protein